MPPPLTSQSTFSTLLGPKDETVDALSPASPEVIDHRKRRRNRTTQSCLNCHTSKRKCDRKRPCHRCTQLGLTGLCVYEVDDPIMRGDLSADEATRLKGRVAELERLVRELRGKPSPRWIEEGYRQNNVGERWHSRALRYSQSGQKRGVSASSDRSSSYDVDRDVSSSLLPAIKTETRGDSTMDQHLYRLSPSPSVEHSPCSVDSAEYRYQNEFSSSGSSDQQTSAAPGTSSYYYAHGDRLSYEQASSPCHATSGAMAAHQTPCPSVVYSRQTGSAPASLSASRNPGFTVNIPDNLSSRYCHSEASPPYGLNSSGCDPMVSSYCPCRNSAQHVYCNLLGHLESSLQALASSSHGHHPGGGFCQLYRRVVELDNAIRNAVEPHSAVSGSSYGSSVSDIPNDSKLMHSSISPTTNSQASFHRQQSPYHGSIGSGHGASYSTAAASSPVHWHPMSSPVPAGYNPYFGTPIGQDGYLNGYVGSATEM